MSRPYVVCHMLTSLDGRIDGSFMRSEASVNAIHEYGRLRGFYACDATLYGTVTMAQAYADGFTTIPDSGAALPAGLREDYIAATDAKNYVVSIDANGEIAYHSNTIERADRPKAHIIQVLTHRASDAYLAYLRRLEISYIFAGDDRLNCRLALQRLKDRFGIARLMVAGGGQINGSLLKEGLIDEMSIVLSPMIEGDKKAASLADYAICGMPESPVAFSLLEATPLHDALWLRYQRAAEGNEPLC